MMSRNIIFYRHIYVQYEVINTTNSTTVLLISIVFKVLRIRQGIDGGGVVIVKHS